MSGFTESIIENATLAWLDTLGWTLKHGPEIAPGEVFAERSDPSYRQVVLGRRLRDAFLCLNRKLLAEVLDDAFRERTWG